MDPGFRRGGENTWRLGALAFHNFRISSSPFRASHFCPAVRSGEGERRHRAVRASQRAAVLGEGRARGTASSSSLAPAIAHGMGVGFETHWTVSAHDLNRADCDFVLDAIADPEAQNESRLTLSKPYGGSGVALAVPRRHRSIHAFVRSRRRRQDRHPAGVDGGDVSRPARRPHLARRVRIRPPRRGRVGRTGRRPR